MKNVLITSAGRRVELLQAFKDELSQLGVSAAVHAGDMNPELSAACHIADRSTRLPKVTDPTYIEYLSQYCVEQQIGLVVPTIDPELAPLASARKSMRDLGVEVVVSDPELIATCSDKRRTGEVFAAAGMRYPTLYSPPDIPFPCFAKPRDGSSSIGARELLTAEDLNGDALNDPNLMFMELIPSHFSEYTVDTYFDRSARLICAVSRKRLEVRAGEVSKGIAIRNFVLDACQKGFAQLPGARGCITIQVFADETSAEIVGLEINPRFGGGFPLAYAAGAVFPRWLITEYLLDDEPELYDSWQDRLLMLRYDAKVLVPDADI